MEEKVDTILRERTSAAYMFCELTLREMELQNEYFEKLSQFASGEAGEYGEDYTRFGVEHKAQIEELWQMQYNVLMTWTRLGEE